MDEMEAEDIAGDRLLNDRSLLTVIDTGSWTSSY
jgi:hypothetical protein